MAAQMKIAGGRSVLLALVVGAVLVIQPDRAGDGGITLLALVPLLVAIGISIRWPVPPVAIAVLVIVGIGLRAALTIHFGSDVLDVTYAAIREVQNGRTPYGVTYAASRPPGAPFPYGPLALLWYLPFVDKGWQLEIFMACVVMALLALRGRLLGLAIYATAPTLIIISGDGSNDTSVGFLLLATFIVARRWPVAGAALLAVCVAFKPYAAAWAPAYFVWGGWSVIGVFGLASAVLWSPVLLVWGVGNFLASLQKASDIHEAPFWSLAAIYDYLVHRSAIRSLYDTLRLAIGVLTAIASLPLARSLDAVILVGTTVYFVTLFGGYWSTYAYFAGIAPLLCWRIDDWLGIEKHPLVRLPQDEPTITSSPSVAAAAA
jgi:hypothetical protein